METTNLDESFKAVYGKLITMCFKTQTAIESAIKSLETNDKKIAKSVIAGDKDIDGLYYEIEQDCLKILLMYHPFATDFREVSSALKMITDLERVGDYAVDIAEIVGSYTNKNKIEVIKDIQLMSKLVIDMVNDSVQAYINKNLEEARKLDKRDDKVDTLFVSVRYELITLIKKNESFAEDAIDLMMVAKYLERIGDHAVNIGEWVDYSITGKHSLS